MVEVAKDLQRRLLAEDPVQGVWRVSNTTKDRIWCDASSVAIGAALKIDRGIVEDALRKVDDNVHVNLAELKFIKRVLNLASSTASL